VAGFSTCDEGVVLDLSLMRGIRIDPMRRTADVQMGCRWRDMDSHTQEFDLAVTGGLVSTTGVAGFTLGGGIGWLTRRCGLAADNLIGADVVTAAGQLVRAEDDQDLLWALKGGGGNFGVVTNARFALHHIGPTVFAGVVVYPGHQAEQVLRRYAEACSEAPDGLTTLLKLTTAPTAAGTSADSQRARVVMVGGCWAGDPAAAEEATHPFRSLGTALTDGFADRSYSLWQMVLDPQFPPGLHCYFRSAFSNQLDEEIIARLLKAHEQLPNRLTEIVIHQLGGDAGRVDPSATAFANRDHDYIINVIARSEDRTGFPGVTQYAKDVIRAVKPDAGTYVNFAGDADPGWVLSSYPPETLKRLVMVKDRYDASNLFRLNQNIPPSGD
jgi:FAD/FMN-containing dehydrogenase